MRHAFRLLATLRPLTSHTAALAAESRKPNVLFIISEDLTATALSSYGNIPCKTPSIHRLAAQGMRVTRAHCQGTSRSPSQAWFLSGCHPHATAVVGQASPRLRRL